MIPTTHTLSRRSLLGQFGLSAGGLGLGGLALAELLGREASASSGVLAEPHLPAKAKRVIYLFQSGGPSQLDLFDDKPKLREMDGQQLPESVRAGQRLTGMSGNQSSIPLAGSPFTFTRHGEGGALLCDQLPHTARAADKICFIRSMYT